MIATPARIQTKSANGFTVHRFTVDQYHRMINAGILTEDDPVELLEGYIVVKGDYSQAPAKVAIPLSIAIEPWPWEIYRFTVDQYHRMIAAGILTEGDRLELLEGWIVEKIAHNPPHATVVTRLTRWHARVLDEDAWCLRGQLPVTLEEGEPEPDIAIARGSDKRYEKRHPGPGDLALLIEVSHTTLELDRIKGAIYAAAKIPQYWIVNLVDGIVEVYTKPEIGKKPGYRSVKKYGKNETIPLVLDGKTYGELPVKQLLS